jgi:DNA-binding response OmpR family regulator
MALAVWGTTQPGGSAVRDEDGAGRILIVEDDPEMRRLLADFLRAEGFQVTQAADAAEALQSARQMGFASVVLDKNLPGEGGLEILPRLRRLLPGTPVILITAFGDARTHEAAFSRGAYDLLFKPFNLDDLLAVLRRAGEYAGEGRPGA